MLKTYAALNFLAAAIGLLGVCHLFLPYRDAEGRRLNLHTAALLAFIAAELLLAGDLNISEVGYKIGFSEPASFSRAFTKVYGKSPRKYISDVSDGHKQL